MRRGPVLLVLAAVLVASSARGGWEGGVQHEVPLDGNGSSWLVRATINGSFTGRFLIDTGATYCVLAPTVARRLQLPGTADQAELHTANGTVRAPVVHLETVDVGGNRARDVPAVVQNAVGPALDGIIGLSYLDHFSYTIDSKRRMLRIH